MNVLFRVNCGQASKQQPQVMHSDITYRLARSESAITAPLPISCEPSMSIHALTFFRFSNMRLRLTCKSRTTGNFDIGSREMGCFRLSTSAVQACRTFPLMIIVHEPHTSSRQFESQVTGLTISPFRVVGFF